MFDVFVSHSSLDKSTFVEPLVQKLTQFGLLVWYDKHNIYKGDKIKEAILKGIEESVFFVAIISENYLSSKWANLELGVLQADHPDNIIPIIFSEIKERTGKIYPFLLDYNYIDSSEDIDEIARILKDVIQDRKQERGLWHIDKTNIYSLVKEMRSYNSFKLDQISIRLSKVYKNMRFELLSTLNEIKLILEMVFSDVATTENIFVSSESSVIDTFLKIEFLNCNLKEHIIFLQRMYQEHVRNFRNNDNLAQEDLYLLQLSLFSIIEWYMITYFKKPIFRHRNITAVTPEDFSKEDIVETYEIEKMVLPPNLIASPDTVLKWFSHNPLTIVGARDVSSGKIIGFFNTLPITDELYEAIKTGDFDDTTIQPESIRQYDIPGFYKLYLCSFCIHPLYNTTSAFKLIYTGFIDFLSTLAAERDIYISDIIADGVTLKGANLCESIGMKKVTTSIHNSKIYEASLIPPAYTTLKLNNVIGHKLLSYYERMYTEYKEIF